MHSSQVLMLIRPGRTIVAAVVLGALAAGWPAAARAQGTESTAPRAAAARLSAGFAVGVALPLHSDLDFTAGAWDASLRIGVERHMVIETAFSEWRHTESSETLNLTLQGPNGVIGHVGRLSQETRRTGRAVQVNVLGRVVSGRIELFAGGGVGMLSLARHYSQRLFDCTSSLENVCRDSESDFSASSLTGQVVGGGDVRLTARLSAFGQVRFTVPVQDVGSSDIRVAGGVRLRLW